MHENDVVLTLRKGTRMYSYIELVCMLMQDEELINEGKIDELYENVLVEVNVLFAEAELSASTETLGLCIKHILAIASSIVTGCEYILGFDAIFCRTLARHFSNFSPNESESYFLGSASTFFDFCKQELNHVPQINALLQQLKGQ